MSVTLFVLEKNREPTADSFTTAKRRKVIYAMTEHSKKQIRRQPRFQGIFDKEKYKEGMFDRQIPLSFVPVYEECRRYITEALDAGLDGRQLSDFEDELAKYMGLKYAVAVGSGDMALTLALRLAAEKLYGSSAGIYTPDGVGKGGTLQGRKVFCPDFSTADMVNPIVFEGGEPVFIDATDEGYGWGMSAEVLAMAFEKYPDVKIVLANHPYGFPGDVLGIRKLCWEHNALMIECVGEALGSSFWVPVNNEAGGTYGKTGILGDYCVLSFSKDGVLGSKGGAVLTSAFYDAEKARYWSDGAQADTPWLQHEELGQYCMMSELDAAMFRGRLAHLDEIIEKKKSIYDRYCEKLDGPLAYVIPAGDKTNPNYWLTCMRVADSHDCRETRDDRQYTYANLHGAAAPMEIYDALQAFGADCKPVYKPMSMQPVYRNHEHFTLDGAWRMYEDFANDNFSLRCDIAKEYYETGIVLPSSAEMTEDEQDLIIGIINACYDKAELKRGLWV